MEFLKDTYNYSFNGIVEGVYFYSFISEGEYSIVKQISFSPIDNLQTYNLGFGNVEINLKGERVINDKSDINNNDFNKVIATVFDCLVHFLGENNGAHVLLFGNSRYKHLLYLRKISANINELQKLFKIYGGTLKNDIPLIPKLKNNDRVVQDKDVDPRIFDYAVIDEIEYFNPKESKNYQFVLISMV